MKRGSLRTKYLLGGGIETQVDRTVINNINGLSGDHLFVTVDRK